MQTQSCIQHGSPLAHFWHLMPLFWITGMGDSLKRCTRLSGRTSLYLYGSSVRINIISFCLDIFYVLQTYVGQVTKKWLSCYLVLLSIDSKTRLQDSPSFVTWPMYCKVWWLNFGTSRPPFLDFITFSLIWWRVVWAARFLAMVIINEGNNEDYHRVSTGYIWYRSNSGLCGACYDQI